MLDKICRELNNYFCDDTNKHFGEFVISNGTIEPLNLKDGQYFRIIGSVFNDGIYQYPVSSLTDEQFEGSVWAMSIPPSLIALAEQIKAYDNENKPSAFTSENFGGYSYSKATGQNGAPIGWQQVFAKELNEWRML